MFLRRHLALLAGLLTTTVVLSTPAIASTADLYVGPHFGDGNVPAGCVVDRDPMNPDNLCYHMKVGLNALDSPKVDVDVLVPVSPDAERDMRIAEQAVEMWSGGIDYLAGEMDLGWLKKGFDMNVRTHEVVVNPNGTLANPINLVDPEIVVTVSNPAGGLGIGIDPLATAGSLGIGIESEDGVPCMNVGNPFSMKGWEKRKNYQHHGNENGGIYVEDCGGVGGNVCFAVNNAIDPVPGASDFFPLFDLVSHEFGHCLTLGHVGDGADGPWGPTPTNDIMAYSTDPVGISKCVSTLDVEGFALRMSRYLDVDGDGKVTTKDRLIPNDVEGDGSNSFQIQNPKDHYYASSTGSPTDCPQADQSIIPGSRQKDWTPKSVRTTRPQLAVTAKGDRITGTASNVSMTRAPRARVGSASDATGDSMPGADITGLKVKASKYFVDGTMKVDSVTPVPYGTSVIAYSFLVGGRRFDSFIPLGGTDGKPALMDNGTGYYLPDGSVTWDAAKSQVRFHISREYLADNQIFAPYTVYGITGLHARSNDWIATADSVPDVKGISLAAPKLGKETRDAPATTKRTTTTLKAGSGSFTPADSTLGVHLVSTVDTQQYLQVPIKKQSSVKLTLAWDDPTAELAMVVNGGAGSVTKTGQGTATVTVPWARRDLSVTIDPQYVFGPVNYTVKATMVTGLKDRDGDKVPDVADACKTKRGPSTGGGCPDTDGDGHFDKQDVCPTKPSISADGCPTKADERVVLIVDGKQIATTTVVTRHGSDRFAFKVPGRYRSAEVRWIRDGKVVARRTV